ncbi:YxiJ family protein [Bacillus sp. REN10]|uniref:YxiJ family protein n=1 Tax=Bacillus sp. REN10 TaxID=2782541 RepID=UPI00193C3042|nr:YxiJ family protein [Bacillus sp. REN10]
MKKDLNDNLKNKLKEINFQVGFPYEDLELIQKKYEEKIGCPQGENKLIEDFNDFLMVVAGSADYILSGKKIPKYQKTLLGKGFFERYPNYAFLEKVLDKYPDFSEELKRHELAREILNSLKE